MQSHSLFVPVATEVLELIFENPAHKKYFKNFYRFLEKNPSRHNPFKQIYIGENSQEYVLRDTSENGGVAIEKSKIYFLKDLRFILMCLIEELAFDKNIIILHGSSFIKNGKALLFCAPSGSGKSTIARSIPEGSILSDDMAVIKIVNGEFHLYSSYLDKTRSPKVEKKILLDRIYFIKKSSINRVTEETLENKLENIRDNNYLAGWLEVKKEKSDSQDVNKLQGKLYNIYLDLIKKIPIQTLYFTKDLTFLSNI